MGYRTTYYALQELVPPEIFTERGNAAWELLDDRLLITLDQIRKETGHPIIINNWHEDGPYRESGLCSAGSSVHAKFSQHKYGRGADLKSKGLNAQELHAYILANHEKFPYVTVLENIAFTPTWVHADVRNSNWTGIRVVNP
jgi:hypothetical protein